MPILKKNCQMVGPGGAFILALMHQCTLFFFYWFGLCVKRNDKIASIVGTGDQGADFPIHSKTREKCVSLHWSDLQAV